MLKHELKCGKELDATTLRSASVAEPLIICVDCKSIYDHHVKMGGAQATADQRTNIELKVLKQTMRTEAVQLRWIDARVMLADCLTKGAQEEPRTFLDHVCDHGSLKTFIGCSRRQGRRHNIQRSAQEVMETYT